MAADLKFLFDKVEPAGAVAGMERGINNARTLLDIEKQSSDIANQDQLAAQRAAMHPFELQMKQKDAAFAQQDMTPEMMELRQKRYSGEANDSYAKGQEALRTMDPKIRNQLLEQTIKEGSNVIRSMMGSLENGSSTQEVISQVDKMYENADQQAKAKWARDRALYSTKSPQELYRLGKLMLDNMATMSPEWMTKAFEQSNSLELERERGRWHINAAAAGRTEQERNQSYENWVISSAKQLYPNNPAAQKAYIQAEIAKNISETQGVGGVQFTTDKRTAYGTGEQPAQVMPGSALEGQSWMGGLGGLTPTQTDTSPVNPMPIQKPQKIIPWTEYKTK